MSEEYIPSFYKEFCCVAGKCPDTCCKDWDIVVDESAYKFYESLNGEYGENIRQSMITDEDGDIIFRLREDGFCPHLTAEKLCGIQVRFGESAVCETCRKFPRISQDYTEFTEYLLSMACPSAAKLMLEESKFDFLSNFTVKREDNGYSKEFMNFLLIARDITAEIFKNKSEPFANRLKKGLAYTEYVQQLIDDEKFDIKQLYEYKCNYSPIEGADRKFVFELHGNLDIMDSTYREELRACGEYALQANEATEREFENLALYYIYRYYLTAIASCDIITSIKRIYCAYVICSALISKNKAENDTEQRILIIQKYSKEVEHSFENTDILTDEFVFNDKFSSEYLISTL